MEVIGIDIGFGFTKATNGRESVVFKSVFGDAADIQYRERLLEHTGKDEHLHISIDGKSYFVGELAERQSTVRSFTLDQDQFIGNFAKILALSALGQMVERNAQVKLVTGLPISYFKRHKDELAESLQGRHTITLVDANGQSEETVVNIAQVRVIPQPFGSLFNLTFNDMAEVTDRRYVHEKIGVIDVGFRTSDYTISDRTRYSERGSRTTDSGISHAFSIIAAKLKEKSGVDIELYRLYEAVARGSIKIRGKSFDLTGLNEQIFGQLASSVATEANRLWTDDWDIDLIVVTGGGGAVLAPHLQPLLRGEVLAIDPARDARFNNVQGYFKYAKHLWARSPAPPKS
jgi:plasmid segregation protein ParM